MAIPAPLAAPTTPRYRLATPPMPVGGTRLPILESPAEPKVPACIWTFMVSSGWMVLWLAARASAPAIVSARGLALLFFFSSSPTTATFLLVASDSAGAWRSSRTDSAFWPSSSGKVADRVALLAVTDLFLRPPRLFTRWNRPLPPAWVLACAAGFTAYISNPPRRLSFLPGLVLKSLRSHTPSSLDALTHLKLNVASVMVAMMTLLLLLLMMMMSCALLLVS
mmetsp:Transcript_5908/g.15298  ORF Transcript_5908/g.15298 Transcript_5908/m.15298 type:complete len:223 (-) Transcript_5908:1282-1950(-)